MQFGGEGVYWSLGEVLDKAVREKRNGGKQRKQKRKRLTGRSDDNVGNTSEHGQEPNGDTRSIGRWGSSFRGVPGDGIESRHHGA